MDKGEVIAVERHDMLFLDREGREYACRRARDFLPGLSGDIEAMMRNPVIPCIVRRQEQHRTGAWEVGFSLPLFRDGVRVRIASLAETSHIIRVVTPYEAIGLSARSEPARRKKEILESLITAGREHGIEVGLYGAFALELLTGLDYTTPDSDLDLLIRPTSSIPNPAGFLEKAAELQARYGVPLDIEALCKGGYGVKLKELLSNQRTVLGKGLYDVQLMPRSAELFRA